MTTMIPYCDKVIPMAMGWVFENHEQSDDPALMVMLFDFIRNEEKHGVAFMKVFTIATAITGCLSSLGISIYIYCAYGGMYGVLWMIMAERFTYLYVRIARPTIQVPLPHWWTPGPMLFACHQYCRMLETGHKMLDESMNKFMAYHLKYVQQKLSQNAVECMKVSTVMSNSNHDDSRSFFDVEVPKDVRDLMMKFAFDEGSRTQAAEWTAAEQLNAKMLSVRERLGIEEDFGGVIHHIMGFAFGPTATKEEIDSTGEIHSMGWIKNSDTGYLKAMVGKVSVFNGITQREVDVRIEFGDEGCKKVRYAFADGPRPGAPEFKGYLIEYY